jgi:hypothetical protein
MDGMVSAVPVCAVAAPARATIATTTSCEATFPAGQRERAGQHALLYRRGMTTPGKKLDLTQVASGR